MLECKFFSSQESVKETLTNTISKLGENIVIRRLEYIHEKEKFLQKYIHNAINSNSGKIGVLLSFSSNNKSNDIEEFSKNICMHIAATDPKSINIDNLDGKLIEKEKSIYKEQLKSSDKPENIIEKIVDGKIKKFYEEVCLMEQLFVMDNKLKIKECITSFNNQYNSDFKIEHYIVFKLGQE